MNVFSDANIGVEAAAELMDVIGISYDDLADPVIYRRFKDIAHHFQNSRDISGDVLRLMKPNIPDALDHVWSYVQLNERYEKEVSKLSKHGDVLDEGILEAVASGNISRDQMKSLRRDLKKPENLKDAVKAREIEKSLDSIEKCKQDIEAYG